MIPARLSMLLFVMFCIVLLSSIAEPVVFVDIDAPLGGNGNSWCTAYNAIQQGLDDADVLDEEVWVAAGTYYEHITLKDGVALYGGFTGCGELEETGINQRDWKRNPTVIDGSGLTAVIGADNAAMDGVTIQHGFGIERHGGMYNDNASPTITNCTFYNNENGIYNVNSSSPVITNCIFWGNVSSDVGGGMYNDNSSPTVTNCTFSYNGAFMYGFGIYNVNSSSPLITNCIFVGNYGGDYVFRLGSGGGILNGSSSPTITNCTFSGNHGPNNGSGIYNYNSSPTITNCILWGNERYEIYNDGNSSPIVSYCDINQDGYEGNNGNIWQDPLFVSDLLGDYYLSQLAAGQGSDSPCIDAGSDTSLNLNLDDRTTRTDSATDIGMVDIGYHYPADSDGDNILNDGDGSGISGDNPCTGGETENCDDNCSRTYNHDQLDTYPPQGNGTGDACDCEGNFDCDADTDGTDAATFKIDFGRSSFNRPCIATDTCNGDFTCDGDVDGTDAALFKSDFGRSQFQNPCPACVSGGAWCQYQ